MFEVIAELWNDASFNPIAPPLECHPDFQVATDCSHVLVAQLIPATPQKIEDCFTSMRSKLIRIIDNWERSGQGEGSMDPEDVEEQDDESSSTSSCSVLSHDADSSSRRRNKKKEFGSLRNRSPRALQSRAAFLRGEPSYLLYFWEIADKHQLLQSSVQRLNEETGAGDASMTASTSTSSRSGNSAARRRNADEAKRRAEYEKAVLASLEDIAKGHDAMRRERHRDRVHDQQLENQRLESERQERHTQRIFQRRTELVDIGRKYRRMNAELDMSNARSQQLSQFYLNECQLAEEELQNLLQQEEDN